MITVVIATYQGERFLCEQLESILRQTLRPHKILIRDDGSQDKTWDILNAYAKRYPGLIEVVPDRSNVGIIGNFSALLEKCDTPYVALSDQDDVWEPYKLERESNLIQKLEETGRPVLVHSDLSVVDASLKTIAESFVDYSFLDVKEPILPKLLSQNHVTGCTCLVNLALLKKALPIPADVPMHDVWLALCAQLFGKIGFVDKPLVKYRQHGKNDTGAKAYKFMALLKKFNVAQITEVRKNRAKKVRQAELLLERFKDLKGDQRQIIEAYIEMNRSLFFKKIVLMWKYRFFKRGLIRNVWEIIGP